MDMDTSRPKDKRRAVRLPPDLHAKAKAYCRTYGVSMAEWVEAWLTLALETAPAHVVPGPPPVVPQDELRLYEQSTRPAYATASRCRKAEAN